MLETPCDYSLGNLKRSEITVPDSMTQILSSGPTGTKVNIAVLGDGFANGADQTIYNNKVNDLLINGLFKNDYYFEDIQAFNVFRVNLISVDSMKRSSINCNPARR
jgi:hypothetical protein